jgi:hypothetical protein
LSASPASCPIPGAGVSAAGGRANEPATRPEREPLCVNGSGGGIRVPGRSSAGPRVARLFSIRRCSRGPAEHLGRFALVSGHLLRRGSAR